MALDFRVGRPDERRDENGVPLTGPSSARRWAFTEDLDAVRIALWGEVGPRETTALDARLLTMRVRSAPVIVDLTGVTNLHEDTVAWLGVRHAELGRERPMLVCVVTDGRVHRRLTQPDAPKLRLTLE